MNNKTGSITLSAKDVRARISTYHYEIQVWEGAAQAIKTLNNKNILNTTEQISANTNNINLAGALALKAAIADYTNKISAISNLATKVKISAISNLATKVKIVYTNAEFSVSEIDFSPFPFGIYMVIAYRFMIII